MVEFDKQMGNKLGNPNWRKGISPNPKGRPRGGNSIEAFYRDPDWFLIKHLRWARFRLELGLTVGNGAKAARLAGYSPESARFIASRLRKKPIIREILKRTGEIINATRKISEGVWLIPDFSGKYHIYRHKKIDKSQHFGVANLR